MKDNNNTPTPKEWEETEKILVGKNKHSVYTHCLSCRTWGIDFPLVWECGNCGNTNRKDLIRYYDLETISTLLSQQKQKLVGSVDISEDDNEGKDELWCAWYKCRNCKGTMIIRSTKYCPDCGLKINWLENK